MLTSTTEKSLAESRGPVPQRVSPDRPVSLVLGGGSVRGLAHVGVLEALAEKRYRVSEIVGASVGAVVLAFYAVLGMPLEEIRSAGLSIRSTHLLCWSILRHLSPAARARYGKFAGIFPEYIGRLARADFSTLHHGVERLGIVVYDKGGREQIICDSDRPALRVEDAVRGSAALPGLFPAWKCESQGQVMRLVDGAVRNPLPVDVLFSPPFQPQQVLAVDISSKPEHRERNQHKVDRLREQFPAVAIQLLCPDTIGGATVAYRSGYLERLIDSARRDAMNQLQV